MDKIIELSNVNCLVQARHGLFLANRQDFYVGNALVLYGEYGEFEWNLLEQLIDPGSTVIEVGANIGTHTISLARLVGPEGRVTAIEPQRVIFQWLCANIALNGFTNVETHQCGCGSEPGTLIVPPVNYSAETRQNFGGVSLQPGGVGEPVRIIPLDDLCGDKSRVRLIKIDVEGMEAEVINGALTTIRESRPILYVENDRIKKSEELIRLLSGLGYRLFWHIPPLFNPDNFFGEQENVYGKVASFNMLCLPNEAENFPDGLQEIKDPTEHPLLPSDLPLSEMMALALNHYNEGRFALAEAVYLKVMSKGSVTAELYKNYGNVLLYQKKYQESEQAYRKALEMNPDYAEAYNNLGNVLRLEGRWNESELAFKEALRLFPDSADIHNNFGTLLMDICQDDLAEQAFRQAILLKPDNAMFYLNRGNALRALGRLGTALKSYRKALELDPVSLDVHLCLAQVLIYLDDIDEAEKVLMRALEIHPSNAKIYNSLGVCCSAKGLFGDAEAAYLQSLAITPDYPTAQFNWSLLKLLQGDLQEGFKRYEHRFDGGSIASFRGIKDLFRNLKDNKRWQGESVDGKALLIVTEQGAGDTLMMMRYIPLLKSKGFNRIMVYCETRMIRLFKAINAVDEVFSKDEPFLLTGFDYFCSMMSFPYLFQTDLNNIPDTVHSLDIPDVEREKWRKLLEGVPGLKVGLVWAGSSINLIDTQRSIQISEFRPLAIIDGISLISLQKGEQCGQAAELGSDCIDYMDMCNDYLDTAALIMNLDLVISVDTSVAHLAGVLGKPVWLLNRFGSEWRWMLDREDSPWYPSMRIFNQEKTGNWAPVIEAVAVELKNLVGDRK